MRVRVRLEFVGDFYEFSAASQWLDTMRSGLTGDYSPSPAAVPNVRILALSAISAEPPEIPAA